MATKAVARKTNGGLKHTSSLSDIFRPWNDWFSEPAWERALTIPAVNITETDKKYHLSLAAPGLDKDDFNIDVQGNILTISSEKEESKDDNDEGYRRHEYNYSSFSRSFTIPEGVKRDEIDAEYKDGVLHVALPKDKEVLKASTRVKIK